MRLFLSFLVACLVAASDGIAQVTAQSPPASPQPDILGTWDAIQRSYGGIGSTLLLSPDSTFALILGAMVDGKYSIDGENFTIVGDEPGSKPDTQKLTYASGTAILSSHGCSHKLSRTDSVAGDSGLVGRWKFMHITGVPAWWEFTGDGKNRLRVPIQVQRGKFSITGNSIALHTLSPERADSKLDFILSGDSLTVSNEAGLHKLVRARTLIPFDVQQPARPKRMLCTPRR